MKNFSKTFAAISMSLLTIGAMAQSEYSGTYSKPKIIVKPVPKGIHIQGQGAQQNVSHNVGAVPTYNAYMNYPAWDYSINNANGVTYQGSSANNGWGAVLVNSNYTKADTGATKHDKNYELIQSFTVSYDSLYDVYSQSILPSNNTTILNIDTIWALVSYKNTSKAPGYIIFTGLNTITGYPGNTVLFRDTVKVGASITQDTSLGKYFGDSLDAGYAIGVLPNYNLNGKSFAVNVTYVGSKADSLEIFYGFPYYTCTPYAYGLQSSIGIPLSGLDFVNTYTTGWPTVFGSVTEMPTSKGEFVIYGVACGDTAHYYEQDAAIFASFTYSSTLGVNNIVASGLSVKQNYPNPFNQQTTINYSLTKSSNVTFTVYDITGRIMTTTNYGNVAPGQYQINLNASTFSPGVYFYTFNVGGSTVTNKMVITE